MRTMKLFASCLVMGALALSAVAQPEKPASDRPSQPPAGDRPPGDAPRPRMGMPALSPEKAKAAWEAQAKGVAAGLGLDETKTNAVVKAYTDSRVSHNQATEKLRKERRDAGGGGGGGPDAMADMRKKAEEMLKGEREKLEKALAASLSAEQVTKAMEPLGTFNPQWDVLTDTVSGFGLDSTKAADASKALQEYVVAMGKGRNSEDRDAARAAMQEARKSMLETMKGLLTEEQNKKFTAAVNGGRGRGDGPGPGGGGEDPAPRRRPGSGGG
ncbi:hypothetical protein PHYC_01594 [Phycisphaerales bacterium]|nr:hypothetical protein PHYC_01594 [Phycisphaerales bacterium]